jgi:hypothetical protein
MITYCVLLISKLAIIYYVKLEHDMSCKWHMLYYHVLTHLPYLHMVQIQIVLMHMHMPHTHKYVLVSYTSHAYFHGVFYWWININCTYIKYILLAHTNGSSLWNIHISCTYTYGIFIYTTYICRIFHVFQCQMHKSMLCTCCTFHMLEGCCIIMGFDLSTIYNFDID